jgi:hypothetical protein
MRRREFIITLGGVAATVAWPRAALHSVSNLSDQRDDPGVRLRRSQQIAQHQD